MWEPECRLSIWESCYPRSCMAPYVDNSHDGQHSRRFAQTKGDGRQNPPRLLNDFPAAENAPGAGLWRTMPSNTEVVLAGKSPARSCVYPSQVDAVLPVGGSP
ncbi:unnamed protein product [Spodoptera exigua]|nr:unnamed protein product [Spodoptera exigua]